MAWAEPIYPPLFETKARPIDDVQQIQVSADAEDTGAKEPAETLPTRRSTYSWPDIEGRGRCSRWTTD